MAEALEMGYFVWAIIVTVIAVALVAVIIYMQRKYQKFALVFEQRIKQKDTKSFQAGTNFSRGELNEVLASFKLLNEYDQIALFSSVSKAFSIDLMGIKEDSVDFIEVKTEGTGLTKSENKVKKLIDEKQVRYRIVEGDIPKFSIKEREEKKSSTTKEKTAKKDS